MDYSNLNLPGDLLFEIWWRWGLLCSLLLRILFCSSGWEFSWLHLDSSSLLCLFSGVANIDRPGGGVWLLLINWALSGGSCISSEGIPNVSFWRIRASWSTIWALMIAWKRSGWKSGRLSAIASSRSCTPCTISSLQNLWGAHQSLTALSSQSALRNSKFELHHEDKTASLKMIYALIQIRE